MTLRDFLVRGLFAGLIAGVVGFGVAYAIGEPSVAASIAIEEASGGHSHETGTAATEPAAEEATEDNGTQVPRELQSTLGLATGTLVLGTALGGFAGILTGLAMGRFGHRQTLRGTALAISGGAFVVVRLVPFLIYPPNPPAVGHGETIAYRTQLYFAMLALSVLAAVLALYVGRRLTARVGGWYAALIGVGIYLAVVVVALGVMPRYDEVPSDFPASLLFEFRQASLVVQAVMWGVIGVVLGELGHRLQVRGKARPDPRALASV